MLNLKLNMSKYKDEVLIYPCPVCSSYKIQEDWGQVTTIYGVDTQYGDMSCSVCSFTIGKMFTDEEISPENLYSLWNGYGGC